MVKEAQEDFGILKEDWPTLKYFLRKIWWRNCPWDDLGITVHDTKEEVN